MTNILEINNKEYKIIDTKEKMTVPDCVVWSTNKIWSWNWESKIYLWQDNEDTLNFFDKWERWFTIKWVVKKSDLLKYLEDIKEEYFNPQLPYWEAYNIKQNKERITQKKLDLMSDLWKKRFDEVNKLDDYIYFDFNDQPQIKWLRVYVNSDSFILTLLRKLSLPNITYLSAIKLEWKDWEEIFYFRLFVDYFDEYESLFIVEEENKILENSSIDEVEKTQVVRARKGQWLYRKKLLEECPFCPITMIWDDRLLIASHIKPWAKSELEEKTDPKNGFMLTPTYDLLFDRWFITFTNDKKIIISPWLSKMTCSKLSISQEKKYPMLPTEGRENYLEYHRNELFKS